MKKTSYFINNVLNRRPEAARYSSYIKQSLTQYITIEIQPDGRTRRWVYVPEADKYLRVIVEPDGETVHNAFFDRNYSRKNKRAQR